MSSEVNDNPEGHIPISHIRPRFKIESDRSAQDLCDKLRSGLDRIDSPCVGEANTRFAIVKIPSQQLHYWSPQLTLTMEELDGKCIVRGLFGPRPAVWTMLMFFYAFVGFAITVIAVLGMSQVTMGDPADILWWIPALIVVFLSIYVVAYFGKQKGHDQMVILFDFFEDASQLKI